MKNNFLIITILMLISASLNAQWDTITSFNQDIMDLKSFDGKLFIGGNFTKNENNTCYWSATYNGYVISKHTVMIGGSGIKSFDVFDNDLYAVGSMQHGYSAGVSKWDGSTWQDGGSTNYSHSAIYTDNNDLYVGSDDGVIRKKSVGGYFQSFYNFNGNGSVSSIIRYGNELIFAGAFDSINGVEIESIAKWDGTNWTPLGTGVSGSIKCMAVYNNELYVAGDFDIAGGISVKSIAKWDGSNWSKVGVGASTIGWSGIRDMTVFNGELYVVGDFSLIGGVATQDVAKWDGSQWSALNLNHDDSFVNCVEVYNNKLYVGTADFNKSHVFVYNGSGIGISENFANESSKFNIYPNPVIDDFNIEIESSNLDDINIEVIDLLGNILISENHQISKNANISVKCEHLAKGTYIVLIREKNSKSIIMHNKFVIN